jgi:hypothetical protein
MGLVAIQHESQTGIPWKTLSYVEEEHEGKTHPDQAEKIYIKKGKTLNALIDECNEQLDMLAVRVIDKKFSISKS